MRTAKAVRGLAITVMILVAVYRIAFLLLGAIFLGIEPRSGFDVADLLAGPVYLASAMAAWKWPLFAEIVSIAAVAVIFARFHPWTMSPFHKGLSCDYAFVTSANVAFFVSLWSRTVGNEAP